MSNYETTAFVRVVSLAKNVQFRSLRIGFALLNIVNLIFHGKYDTTYVESIFSMKEVQLVLLIIDFM